MIGSSLPLCYPPDWSSQPVLFSYPVPDLPLDKTYPTGGSLRVFKHFAWLEVGSGKMVLSRPAHQRVTPAVRQLLAKER
jgi:hypothetical protein